MCGVWTVWFVAYSCKSWYISSELDNDLPSVHDNPNKNDKDNVEQRPQRARAVVHVALCPRPSGEVPLAALGLLLLKPAEERGLVVVVVISWLVLWFVCLLVDWLGGGVKVDVGVSVVTGGAES